MRDRWTEPEERASKHPIAVPQVGWVRAPHGVEWPDHLMYADGRIFPQGRLHKLVIPIKEMIVGCVSPDQCTLWVVASRIALGVSIEHRLVFLHAMALGDQTRECRHLSQQWIVVKRDQLHLVVTKHLTHRI